VPKSIELNHLIMDEFHRRPYVGHPGYQKMVTIVRQLYYFQKMKQDIVEYISKFLECQQVKVEHKHPTGLLQPFPIPEWKWETISMDFVTSFPRTVRKSNLLSKL
jgi:hypothetical protein